MATGKTDRLEAIRRKVRAFPAAPGVYLMKDGTDQVLYVGKAANLRTRVASYFQPSADLGSKKQQMVMQVNGVEFLECDNEVEATLTEARLIKDIRPKFNARLTDDKTFPYIEITTREDFPRVRITRNPSRTSKNFGPFTSVYDLRQALQLIQRVFKFRTCALDIVDSDPKNRFFRPCLLYAISQCTAPCADKIDKLQYGADIDRLKNFLQSKRSQVEREMTSQMQALSAEQKFEQAAAIRDQLKALAALSNRGGFKTHFQAELFHIDPTAGLEGLCRLLETEGPPRTIEAIDIAHLQGGEMVGSLVCFIDGRPFKNGYRRFKIKHVHGVDDYAAIREVVARRYRQALTEQELFPDLILIDGGLGQLHAAMDAFRDGEHMPPMVIALAKREEEIFVQKRAAPIKLGRNNPALQLLQAIRDESHRFAQHYHHILRRKKTLQEDGKPKAMRAKKSNRQAAKNAKNKKDSL